VLVGHSYGGAVITNAATGNPQVKALVYVDAFAPAQGQTLAQLLAFVPGSCAVPANLNVVPFPGAPSGVGNAYITQSVPVVHGQWLARQGGTCARRHAAANSDERPHRPISCPRLFGFPATGKTVRWDEIDNYRVANGKITEEWSSPDVTNILYQIGAYTPPWIS
jgi:pimeloyl-ACP methyl ester carboxylesterase